MSVLGIPVRIVQESDNQKCPVCEKPILLIKGKLAPRCAGCGAMVHELWLEGHQRTVKKCPRVCIEGNLPDWATVCPMCGVEVEEKKELTEPDPWVYDYGKMPPVFRAKLGGEEE